MHEIIDPICSILLSSLCLLHFIFCLYLSNTKPFLPPPLPSHSKSSKFAMNKMKPILGSFIVNFRSYLLFLLTLSLVHLKLHKAFIFMKKSAVSHLLCLRRPCSEKEVENEREEKRALHPTGFEPSASRSRVMFSTAVLQQLPYLNDRSFILIVYGVT